MFYSKSLSANLSTLSTFYLSSKYETFVFSHYGPPKFESQHPVYELPPIEHHLCNLKANTQFMNSLPLNTIYRVWQKIFLPSISSCMTLSNTFWYASLSSFDISGNSTAGTTFGTRCFGSDFGSERPSFILRIKCMARTNSSTLRMLSLLMSARFLKWKKTPF